MGRVVTTRPTDIDQDILDDYRVSCLRWAGPAQVKHLLLWAMLHQMPSAMPTIGRNSQSLFEALPLFVSV